MALCRVFLRNSIILYRKETLGQLHKLGADGLG